MYTQRDLGATTRRQPGRGAAAVPRGETESGREDHIGGGGVLGPPSYLSVLVAHKVVCQQSGESGLRRRRRKDHKVSIRIFIRCVELLTQWALREQMLRLPFSARQTS